jgi:uncharacterized protein YukE
VLSELLIPVSAGELLDKKAILEIKRERLKDDGQRANVERELALLSAIARERLGGAEFAGALAQLESELRAINETLWDLENTVRAFERSGDFSAAFVDAARSIYAGNDRRASVKRKINLLLGSQLIEEKSHGR